MYKLLSELLFTWGQECAFTALSEACPPAANTRASAEIMQPHTAQGPDPARALQRLRSVRSKINMTDYTGFFTQVLSHLPIKFFCQSPKSVKVLKICLYNHGFLSIDTNREKRYTGFNKKIRWRGNHYGKICNGTRCRNHKQPLYSL